MNNNSRPAAGRFSSPPLADNWARRMLTQEAIGAMHILAVPHPGKIPDGVFGSRFFCVYLHVTASDCNFVKIG